MTKTEHDVIGSRKPWAPSLFLTGDNTARHPRRYAALVLLSKPPAEHHRMVQRPIIGCGVLAHQRGWLRRGLGVREQVFVAIKEANMKAILCIVAIAGVVAVSTPAHAQSCQENFQVEGVVLLTALNYRTWQSFPGIDHRKALNSLRSAMLAEGFINVDMDRAGGALTAVPASG
jgi:hypothetical protein